MASASQMKIASASQMKVASASQMKTASASQGYFLVRLLSICLYMREIASACRGYFNKFRTRFDICCETCEKITEYVQCCQIEIRKNPESRPKKSQNAVVFLKKSRDFLAFHDDVISFIYYIERVISI